MIKLNGWSWWSSWKMWMIEVREVVDLDAQMVQILVDDSEYLQPRAGNNKHYRP